MDGMDGLAFDNMFTQRLIWALPEHAAAI